MNWETLRPLLIISLRLLAQYLEQLPPPAAEKPEGQKRKGGKHK